MIGAIGERKGKKIAKSRRTQLAKRKMATNSFLLSNGAVVQAE